MYVLLYEDTAADTDLACSQWNTELSAPLSGGDWEAIHPRAFSSSKNVNMQEHCYKIRARWYRTLVSLHKIFSRSSDIC